MKKVINLTIVIMFITVSITVWGNEGSKPVVTQSAYLDIATGHKYIKNSDTTYSEYSKKGKLLRKSVPNNLSLLVLGQYIREIRPGSYLLYEKTIKYRIERQILPASNIHPKGWQCQDILLPVKNFLNRKNMNLSYTKTPGTIQYNGQKAVATGLAYYDMATGHKYIKNSDTTYSEYSKKGKLLRTDVHNDLSLLTSGRYIFDLNRGDYIIYEKKRDGKTIRQVLSATNSHPKGWCSRDILASGKELSRPKNMGL